MRIKGSRKINMQSCYREVLREIFPKPWPQDLSTQETKWRSHPVKRELRNAKLILHRVDIKTSGILVLYHVVFLSSHHTAFPPTKYAIIDSSYSQIKKAPWKYYICCQQDITILKFKLNTMIIKCSSLK